MPSVMDAVSWQGSSINTRHITISCSTWPQVIFVDGESHGLSKVLVVSNQKLPDHVANTC